jgi:hypothetical protein
VTFCATHDCGCPHNRGHGLAAYSRDPIKKIGKLTVKKKWNLKLKNWIILGKKLKKMSRKKLQDEKLKLFLRNY